MCLLRNTAPQPVSGPRSQDPTVCPLSTSSLQQFPTTRIRNRSDGKKLTPIWLVPSGPSLDTPSHPNQTSGSRPHQQGLTQQEPQEPWSLICLIVGQLGHCSRASKFSGRSMSSANPTLEQRRTLLQSTVCSPIPERTSKERLSLDGLSILERW